MNVTCTDCNGAGETASSWVDGSGGFLRVSTKTTPCATCNGTGIIETVKPQPNPYATNGYARAARERKAWHLYDAAQQLHVNADDMTDAEIRKAVLTCARLIGPVNNPSDATWAIVAEHLASHPAGNNT